MSASDVPARLIRVFLSELDDRLSAFDSDVLALEAPGSDAQRAGTLTRMFRGAHSLKGAAASVGASAIEMTCQQLEDVLAALRDGAVSLQPQHIERFLKATTELRAAGNALAGPAPSPSPAATNGASDGSAEPAASVATETVRDPTIRVAANALDELLEQTGELLVAHHRTSDLYRDVLDAGATVQRLRDRHHSPELQELHRSLDRIATFMRAERELLARASGDLDTGIRALRLVPFGTACEGLERVVRDAAKATGKDVALEISGADAGVDRVTLERLRDPLVHLVRNAVDHGIESPAERRARGKAAVGTVRLAVSLRGGNFELSVSDDGRGLDLDALRARMRERGVPFDPASDLSAAVFLPGMSTAPEVTSLSGRGVGLDVVRNEVEALRGSVAVTSTTEGAQFLITMPISHTTVRVVLIESGGQQFAINVASIVRIVRVTADNTARVKGRRVLLEGGAAIPLVSLDAALGIAPAANAERDTIALLLSRNGQRAAITVDALVDEREIHLRPFGQHLAALQHVAGASVGSDGGIALVLRSSVLLSTALRIAGSLEREPVAPVAAAAPHKRVLLVDDSITTRALERSILEAAGFQVVTAADGRAAWTLLETENVDLVVSDVDMPEMDGIALVEAIRGSAALRALPVILVTGRENEIDRKRGLDAGADAYIVKSTFRQEELLAAIGALA